MLREPSHTYFLAIVHTLSGYDYDYNTQITQVTTLWYSMRDTDRPPLPEWIEDVYSWLETHIQTDSDQESLDRHQAIELAIDAHPEHDLNSNDLEYAFGRLINRGYLYEVDNSLYITEFGR